MVEEMMAAIHAGYRYDELAEQDIDTRAMVIALYRTKNQIDAIMAHEQRKAAEKANRRGKPRHMR